MDDIATLAGTVGGKLANARILLTAYVEHPHPDDDREAVVQLRLALNHLIAADERLRNATSVATRPGPALMAAE